MHFELTEIIQTSLKVIWHLQNIHRRKKERERERRQTDRQTETERKSESERDRYTKFKGMDKDIN